MSLKFSLRFVFAVVALVALACGYWRWTRVVRPTRYLDVELVQAQNIKPFVMMSILAPEGRLAVVDHSPYGTLEAGDRVACTYPTNATGQSRPRYKESNELHKNEEFANAYSVLWKFVDRQSDLNRLRPSIPVFVEIKQKESVLLTNVFQPAIAEAERHRLAARAAQRGKYWGEGPKRY